jgi:hypothetical protein
MKIQEVKGVGVTIGAFRRYEARPSVNDKCHGCGYEVPLYEGVVIIVVKEIEIRLCANCVHNVNFALGNLE